MAKRTPAMTAEEFQKMRKSLGWTWEELTGMLGMSPRTVYGYGNGDRPVPLHIAVLLDLYLHVQKKDPETLKRLVKGRILSTRNDAFLDVLS